MSASNLIVLKFGGSVLQHPDHVHCVAQEIYRWRRSGYQVVAVVSAIGDTTNQLESLVGRAGNGGVDNADPRKTACLLATGELQSAALVGLALDRAGIDACVCDDSVIGLKTTGPALDARPVSINVDALRSQLAEHGVVVLPGFIGRDASGAQTLLGRGGSDLTAIFIAAQLGNAGCRLVKDVSGLFEFDPKLTDEPPGPRRFLRATFDDALQLDESIVQHKAIRFAKQVDQTFEVAALNEQARTRIGNFSVSSLENLHDLEHRPIRVALLGLGTVGWGVYQQLCSEFESLFSIQAVAVKDRQAAIAKGVPESILATDANQAIQSDCDVVIELVGGSHQPRQWIESALLAGKHVITANKALLASDVERLEHLALEHSASISWSAAVGGAVPILETIRSISRSKQIRSVTGIVNGSTNYIIDKVSDGVPFDDALSEAVELGLTELDPHRDLGGIDAAEKLVLIAHACGLKLEQRDIACESLDSQSAQPLGAGSVRQIVQFLVDASGHAKGSVNIVQVSSDSSWAKVHGACNRAEIKLAGGESIVIAGVGAGRWPTTAAVIADLLQLSNRINNQRESSIECVSGALV